MRTEGIFILKLYIFILKLYLLLVHCVIRLKIRSVLDRKLTVLRFHLAVGGIAGLNIAIHNM